MINKNVILLVEEEKGEQEAFEQFFTAIPGCYDYTIAASVKDARRLLKEKTFDVVISDINFVDGHVFDLLPHAKGIPFIIVTAKGYEELAVTAIQRGASDYLVRDVDRHYLDILPQVIKKATYHKRNDKLVEILLGAFKSVDECLCVLNPDANLIFANPAFMDMFGLTRRYYLKNIHAVIKKFQVTGRPEIETFFTEKNVKETRYRLSDPDTGCTGSLRIIPVTRRKNGISGYVLLGHCNAE